MPPAFELGGEGGDLGVGRVKFGFDLFAQVLLGGGSEFEVKDAEQILGAILDLGLDINLVLKALHLFLWAE